MLQLWKTVRTLKKLQLNKCEVVGGYEEAEEAADDSYSDGNNCLAEEAAGVAVVEDCGKW